MRKILLYLSIVLGCFEVAAQSSTTFRYRVLNSSNGLPSNNITCFSRDKKGFLWIGTDKGITRYADKFSINFSDNKDYPIQEVNSMVLMDSIIWVGTKSGLYKINENSLEFELVKGTGGKYFGSLTFCGKNLLYACGFEGSVYEYIVRENRFSKIQTPYTHITALTLHNGIVFGLTLNGKIFALHPENHKRLREYSTQGIAYSDRFFKDRDGNLLVSRRAIFLKYNSAKDVFEPFQFHYKGISYFLDEDDQHFLYIKNSNALYQNYNGNEELLNTPLGANAYLYQIGKDVNGDFILISNQGLVILRRYHNFKSIPDFSNTKSQVRRAVVEDVKRGRILFFSYSNMMAYDPYNGKVIKELGFDHLTHAVFDEGDSILVAGESGKIMTMRKADYKYQDLITTVNPSYQFIALSKDSNDHYLIGATKSLFATKNIRSGLQRISLEFKKKKYSNILIKAIAVQSVNEIWVGTSDGLFVLDSNYKVLSRYGVEEAGLQHILSNQINCLYSDSTGIYIGLDGDVLHLKNHDAIPRSLYASFHARPNNRIVCILRDLKGNLWFSSYFGIYRYDVVQESLRAFHAPFYFQNDEFNRSSSLRSFAGKLYFGSLDEYIEIDPDLYQFNLKPPPFLFNSIKIFENGKSIQVPFDYKDSISLHLSQSNSSLDINFSINDVFSGEGAQYRYRINQLGQDWIELGTNPSIQLFSLPAGYYKIEIGAISNDGFELPPLKLNIQVPEYFYRSIWFHSLAVFLILCLISAFYIMKIRGLKKFLRFRMDIANDIHDSVGTAVTKTIYAAQGIQREGVSQDPRLQEIIEYGRQVNSQFRDSLWSIESKTDEIVNLFDRISEIGIATTENTNFNFILNKSGIKENLILDAKEKRNILLIAREALHNALKHSKGNLISFTFKQTERHLYLRIRDNGKNESLIIDDSKGMGLQSMRIRAKRMGATIEFYKLIDGFVIDLKLKSY